MSCFALCGADAYTKFTQMCVDMTNMYNIVTFRLKPESPQLLTKNRQQFRETVGPKNLNND